MSESFYGIFVDCAIRPLYTYYADEPERIDKAVMDGQAWDIALGSSLPADTSIQVQGPDGVHTHTTVGALRDFLKGQA